MGKNQCTMCKCRDHSARASKNLGLWMLWEEELGGAGRQGSSLLIDTFYF